MNYKALAKTARLFVIPCQATMFTDLVTKPRNFYFPLRNLLPLNPFDKKSCGKVLCDRAINTNQFFWNPVVARCEEGFQHEDYHSQPEECKLTRSIQCQTQFRESSAQTVPWLPNAKLRAGEKDLPEVLLVNCECDPGVREIEAIEKARVRRKWEKALPYVTKKSFPMRIAHLEAFEWESLMTRERELNEMQNDRLEQVYQMIDECHQKNQSFTETMMKNVEKRNFIELEQKKNRLNISVQRKIRKLKKESNRKHSGEHTNLCTKADKPLTVACNSQANLQVLFKTPAPSATSVKLSELLGQRKNLWKSKEPVKETAHGFLKEGNLKSLNESIKKLNVENKPERLRCRKHREVVFKDSVKAITNNLDDK